MPPRTRTEYKQTDGYHTRADAHLCQDEHRFPLTRPTVDKMQFANGIALGRGSGLSYSMLLTEIPWTGTVIRTGTRGLSRCSVP